MKIKNLILCAALVVLAAGCGQSTPDNASSTSSTNAAAPAAAVSTNH
jgi:hypothetical protein